MFGFLIPRCPKCGGELSATGYSFPYPQGVCTSCVNRNHDMKKQVAAEVRKQLAAAKEGSKS